VDAVSRIGRVFWALFPSGLFFKAVPCLFFVLGALLTLIEFKQPQAGAAIGIAFVYFVPAACFILSATANVIRYCEAAGALGVPGHAQAVRSAQALMLFVFVGLPSVVLLLVSAEPLGGVAFLIGGSAVVAVPLLLLPVYLGLVIAKNAPGGWDTALGSPWVQVGISLAGVAVFYHWLRLPLAIETRAGHKGGRTFPGLTGHAGQPPVMIGPDTPLNPTAGSQPALETLPLTPGDLGVGLDAHTAFRWGFVLALVMAGCLLVLVGNLDLVRLSTGDAYRLMSLACALHAARGVFRLQAAWVSRTVEEEVLSLTPRWPQGMRFKWLLLRTVLGIQLEAWISLAGLTIIGVLLEWVRPRDLQIAGLFIGVASLASTPMFLLAVVFRACTGLALRTIACWVCCGLGLLLCVHGNLVGRQLFAHAVGWGVGMLATPLLVALALFWIRPVCFPSQRTDAGLRRRVLAIFAQSQ
jgi:hypothetical protein